jgi:hypothetical protein
MVAVREARYRERSQTLASGDILERQRRGDRGVTHGTSPHGGHDAGGL